CAHRTHVLGHERVRVIELSARSEYDFPKIAALALVEHRIADHFVAKTNATRADNAALGVVNNGWSKVDSLRHVDDLILHALLLAAMLEPVVLEPALTRLITNGAINRMIEQ